MKKNETTNRKKKTSPASLEKWRKQIAKIDQEIFNRLKKRMEISEKIGRYKIENNLSLFQKEIWQKMMQTRRQWAKAHSLNGDFVCEVFESIHKESLRLQTAIKQKKRKNQSKTKGQKSHD